MRMRFRLAGTGPALPNPVVWLLLCVPVMQQLALNGPKLG